MILEIGLMLLVFWFVNVVYMMSEIAKHTPNFREAEPEEIVMNFIQNTPMERVEFLHAMTRANTLALVGGITLVIFSFI